MAGMSFLHRFESFRDPRGQTIKDLPDNDVHGFLQLRRPPTDRNAFHFIPKLPESFERGLPSPRAPELRVRVLVHFFFTAQPASLATSFASSFTRAAFFSVFHSAAVIFARGAGRHFRNLERRERMAFG